MFTSPNWLPAKTDMACKDAKDGDREEEDGVEEDGEGEEEKEVTLQVYRTKGTILL